MHIGIPCYCMVVKAYRDVQGIACDAETSEDRGAVLCALHSPRRLSGPVASAQSANSAVRRWRYAQCRELLLSCLTQLAASDHDLVQAVSVGCCRYFVALVVELEAMRMQQ